MEASGRVIWKEGLFLQPHHFQQMERSIVSAQNTRWSTIEPFAFGLISYRINRDALANGMFELQHCIGITPDGTPFDLPAQSPQPASRPFADHMRVDQQDLDVYLALPLMVEGRANVGKTGAQGVSDVRFAARTVSLTDDLYGLQKKEIEIGDLNFSVLFGDEKRENYSCIKIARLVRNQHGQMELDESYIPPILHIGCCPALLNQMKGLLELLVARSSALSQGRKQVAGGFAEYKGADVTAYLLLQTLNTFTPLLNYFNTALTVHPYELFKHLTSFTGALCTFTTQFTMRNLPRYDHTDLRQVFEIFNRIIRGVLEADISAGCISLPIESVGSATYLCKVNDDKLFTQARFFFGIAAKVSDKELVIGTLQRIKMCSRDRLELLIPSAMPGLTMIHTQTPPAGLSTKPGFIYFALDQQGDFWEGMKTNGTIAFYFPNNFPELRMEILALKE